MAKKPVQQIEYVNIKWPWWLKLACTLAIICCSYLIFAIVALGAAFYRHPSGVN